MLTQTIPYICWMELPCQHDLRYPPITFTACCCIKYPFNHTPHILGAHALYYIMRIGYVQYIDYLILLISCDINSENNKPEALSKNNMIITWTFLHHL